LAPPVLVDIGMTEVRPQSFPIFVDFEILKTAKKALHDRV